MCEQVVDTLPAWNVLLVEDEEDVRRQIHEYLSGESFSSRSLNITDIPDPDQAMNLIHERKADLLILDVYRGTAQRGGEQIGLRVLEKIKQSGFVAVVVYTALPEGLDGIQSSFIRLVGKEAGGLERLKTEIDGLFRSRVPQVHRAIVNHIDQTLRSYMWDFVQENWAAFSSLTEKPEFTRLLIQRLAITLSREGVDRMIEEVYGLTAAGRDTERDVVHAAEYYIKPPIGQYPMLGDIRLRQIGESSEYLVVLWPTCDMVSTGGRTPKTEFALCAKATLAKNSSEVVEWIAAPSNSKQKMVERLVKNKREESPDRYHFLPGVWDIPDLLVDFQKLEHVALDDIFGICCLATLSSPFAEALGARFQRYIGRIGTPDLDVAAVVEKIKTLSAPVTAGRTTASR